MQCTTSTGVPLKVAVVLVASGFVGATVLVFGIAKLQVMVPMGRAPAPGRQGLEKHQTIQGCPVYYSSVAVARWMALAEVM